jgi:hypothetical protein
VTPAPNPYPWFIYLPFVYIVQDRYPDTSIAKIIIKNNHFYAVPALASLREMMRFWPWLWNEKSCGSGSGKDFLPLAYIVKNSKK